MVILAKAPSNLRFPRVSDALSIDRRAALDILLWKHARINHKDRNIQDNRD